MAGWRFHINGAQSRLAWFNNQPLSRFLIEQDINKVIIGIVPNRDENEFMSSIHEVLLGVDNDYRLVMIDIGLTETEW
jgi:hypothetical protein